MTSRALVALLSILTAANLMLAQPPDSGALLDPSPTVAGPQSAQWSRLGVEDKLRYDGLHFVDINNFAYAGIGAAIDQWRGRPGVWGQGEGAYSERYASHLGQYAIQRSIMFSVQAIDHEDARFFRSTRTSYQARLGDAFLHTIWRHDDTGGMMPAYSEFFGDYGAAALSRMWWPQRFQRGPSIFTAGSDTILIDAGINVLHEFAPDLKRWAHFRHRVR